MQANTMITSGLHGQRGATLLVGLVMLLLMTLIGLAAMRGSGMQELMAGNMRDRNLAFQSAEAGLRAAEQVLNGATLPAFDGSQVGYAQDINGSKATGFWSTYNWAAGSVLTQMGLDRVAEQPRFVIEEVSSTIVNAGADGSGIDFASSLKSEDIIYYRVTSRGVGGTNNSVVIVQSTFKR
ncbi:pilus assembly PilX family protein [Microbulbifer yueqingensis]|uniref:Type IV pilus assembly protein PilX n=1 Tax=Microbulbifer yueqingensis TaxID=658219 RepID=A0A1G9EW35_9GAMM|nr:PilX N-terminal domain-containing pilus assembly protein [Microbulbifer yueqingensis]SDK80331.1 type IV pilus assembly protein PilX [Microbulbifer yueqingensis]